MKLINNILAFLFPVRETAKQIEDLSADNIIAAYQPTEHTACISLASFQNPIVRACIHEIKFYNNDKGARLLAELLTKWLEAHVHNPTLLLPVPLSSARFRKRGYNQVTRIAQYSCKQNKHLVLATKLLQRTRDTAPQTTLSRKDRKTNIKDAFRIRNTAAKKQLSNAHIILLDDVYTTGATIRSAKQTLLDCNPASVTCVTIAH
ncbi:MAG: phosphoribosyltransferase family protein [Candidatus Paceibacterota bacterium]